MATSSGGENPPEIVNHLSNEVKGSSLNPDLREKQSYANVLKPNTHFDTVSKIQPKPVIFVDGEPSITWMAAEVRSLIIHENLQYAIIGKFSYGKPDVTELRKAIPNQCRIKGDCTIGVLDSRHVLIRLAILEDYIKLLSTNAYYIKAKDRFWQMRTLKWDPWFEADVETTIGIAWISFPDLPPNFFAKEAIFSIASAIGKSFSMDLATMNQTRPSCARVKVEIDMTADLHQRIRINEEDNTTGIIKSKWIQVQYDYMPKYCKECKLQGHDDNQCWNKHPELHEGKKEEQRKLVKQQLEGGKEQYWRDNMQQEENKQQWLTRRSRYKKDKYGHIIGEVEAEVQKEIPVSNTFEALTSKDNQERGKLERKTTRSA